ncbi:MAG: hypothetical protein Fues2KO_04780 [Fuerstiella sp.]
MLNATYVTLKVDQIDEDPQQPRQQFDEAEQRQLAESLQAEGQLQPAIVYQVDDRYVLLDGHRRLDALRRAGRSQIDAMILPERPDTRSLLILQLTANGQRSDLKPLEKAEAYRRLQQQLECNNTELARVLHVNKATVTMYLSLLRLPSEARRLVDSDQLKPSTAYAILRNPDAEHRRELFRQAMNGTPVTREHTRHRAAQKAGTKPHSTCRLQVGEAVVSIGVPEASLEHCIAALQQAQRVCRKAMKDGLSVATLQKMLADQHTPS